MPIDAPRGEARRQTVATDLVDPAPAAGLRRTLRPWIPRAVSRTAPASKVGVWVMSTEAAPPPRPTGASGGD